MFGFGKKKDPTPPTRRSTVDKEKNKAQTKAQLNLFGVPGLHDENIDLEVDDEDIENELLALIGGQGGGGIPKKPRPRAPPKNAPVIDPFEIPNYEINSGDESDNDDDGEIDDAELEAELGQLTGAVSLGNNEEKPQITKSEPRTSSVNIVDTLQERLALYEKAKSHADAVNDNSKSRRFGRGVKTLEELLKKAKLGKVIDETEIPPIVATGEKKVAPPPPPPTQVARPDDNALVSPLIPLPATENKSFPAVVNNENEDKKRIPERHSFLPPGNTHQGSTPPVIPVFEPIPQIPMASKVEPVSEPQVLQNQIDPEVEQRLKDYKKMAVGLKRAGDSQGGLTYLKLAKALEGAIKSGNPVDLSIFPSVMEESQPSSSTVTREDEKLVSAPTPDTNTITVTNVPIGESTSEGESLQLPNELFTGPEAPKTIMEALQQRLDKYKSEVEKANAANNGSKARRMGRIVKQYEEAITMYKKGKPVVYDELPTPPGFAPIPVPSISGGSVSAVGGGGGSSISGPSASQNVLPSSPQITNPHPKTQPPPAASDVSPNKLSKPNDDAPTKPGSSPSTGTTSTTGSITRPGKPSTKLTLQEKQLAAILQRQKLFKEAALNAKKNGNIEQAREYLRISKGFDKLIQASQAGLPVDMNTLPSAPEAVAALEAEDFELVSGEDCIEVSGTMADVFSKLEEDLKNQIKLSMRTRDHYKSIGDVASANRFEKLALESKRDLDTLRLAAKQGSSIPKYHYETRIFSITECNADLTADEIEVNVIQGVNYRVTNPADVDTFVKVELPYPSAEEAQVNKTVVIKDTNNPAYNAVFKMSINRSARNFQRFIHRHGIKFEVWAKGGFLRSSTLIGQGVAKLLSLETKCSIHEAVDLLDGRKPVGKLEVKIRLREPVITKEITQKKEKWLSIDRA